MDKLPKKSEIRATHMDTTKEMRAIGGRNLEDYKEYLGFDEKELEGKRVLDLGSGSLEKLARDLKQVGINASVIALNPDYILKKYRDIIKNQPHWKRKSVAGVGQALPFQDASFDVILGLESVTLYEDALHEANSAKAWAREIARVLKPGGEARLGEILGLRGEKKQKAWEGIKAILESLGTTATIEPFRTKKGEIKYRLIVKKLKQPDSPRTEKFSH